MEKNETKLFKASQNVRKRDEGELNTLKAVYNTIKNNEKLKTLTENVRNESDKKARQELKANTLPVIAFNSITSGRATKNNIVEMTGYMVIDIDDLKDQTEAEKLSETLFNDDKLGIVLSFVSPSGNGVKAVVKAPQITRDNFIDMWKSFGVMLKIYYNIDVDKATKDETRATYLCHDTNAHYTENQDKQFKYDADLWKTIKLPKDKDFSKIIGNPESENKHQFSEITLDEKNINTLKNLMRDFAQWCEKNKVCLFPCTSNGDNGYNLWLGFGAQLHRLFKGSKEGLDIFKTCSKYTTGYNEQYTNEKWRLLPQDSDPRNLIGTLCNASKNGHKTTFQMWLNVAKTKHRITQNTTIHMENE